jgi:hypothetical protein
MEERQAAINVRQAHSYIAKGMHLASDYEMMNRMQSFEDDEFKGIEDAQMEAIDYLRFGLDGGTSDGAFRIIDRFVHRVVPYYVSANAREAQLELLASGALRRAFNSLEGLFSMPSEYADLMLDAIVEPFEKLRNA